MKASFNTLQKVSRAQCRVLFAALLLIAGSCEVVAQDDDDIWKELYLQNVDVQREKDYCLRLFCYYRFIEEGGEYVAGRKTQEYYVYEGICQMDVRYTKKWDDGIQIIAGRNLVHPDGHANPDDIEYWQLRPYTFLEKARRLPKTYTLETSGDTTRVFTKRGLAGVAVRDTASQELRIDYNALAPDTSFTINILLAKVHLSHVDAHAVYRLEDTAVDYVPQGNLKYISFEGDMDASLYSFIPLSPDESGKSGALRMRYHDRTEFYVDSVVYMTRSEYNADRRLTSQDRRQRCGYTAFDIDRLKQKLGVPPLTSAVLQRIEDQRDWDDEFSQWRQVDRRMKVLDKAGEKVQQKMEKLEQSPAAKKMADKVEQTLEKVLESKEHEE